MNWFSGAAVSALLLFTFGAQAQNYVDAQGREWRKMALTGLRVSATQMKTVCAQDPCAGTLAGVDLTGSTWASQEDVLELMREFEPNAPSGGQAEFFSAGNFSASLGLTYMFNTTYSMSEGTAGLTSSVDPETQQPIVGFAGYGHAMVSIDGGFGFGTAATDIDGTRSVFIYRRAGIAPPPPPPANCSLNGSVIPHGASVSLFQSANVPFGQTCQQESRTCTNGILSGSFTAASCSVAPPPPPKKSCTLNGVIIPHGSSVIRFDDDSVSYGATCKSQSRTCNDGRLSGSYKYITCVVKSKKR